MALAGLGRAGCYNIYVLILLLATYLLNQLDRYMLAITVKPMAQEIHFGDKGCMVNESLPTTETDGFDCKTTNQTACSLFITNQSDEACKWDYNGQGYEYQIVAGPVFILIYTFTGIFIGFAADMYNRKVLLASCLLLWSLMTLLTGFIKEYWHLVILRFGLGIGEAGCTPFAASIIADLFTEDLRGSALGVYNWGIYMGYSLSYAVGNFITDANINGQGWRWSFIISGIPGLVLGVVIMATVKEPERVGANRKANHTTQSDENLTNDAATNEGAKSHLCRRLGEILKPFLCPSLLLLCIAGSVRNSGGYVWAYNAQPYFVAIGQTKDQIGKFMSWIPLVGGSLGVVLGGFISDRIVKRRGLYARVIVLVASQVLAAPFAAGTLFFDPPWAYIFQIPTYIIGEMWVGVTLAVLVELVPSTIRTSSVAVYLFIISNIAGNVPLLVPLIQQAFENDGVSETAALRGALYILYPAPYVAGSALFLLTMFVLKRDQQRSQRAEYTPIPNAEEDEK